MSGDLGPVELTTRQKVRRRFRLNMPTLVIWSTEGQRLLVLIPLHSRRWTQTAGQWFYKLASGKSYKA
jgi:hypothetical protein